MVQGHGSLDGEQILKPETLGLMMQNHLPEGKVVELPNWENAQYRVWLRIRGEVSHQ